MAIEVRCPNGHRLKCPEERAGKRGKCPACGTSFRVPELNGHTEAALAGEAAEGSAPASTVTAASESGKKRIRDGAAEAKITFLCPNDHKLSGPASLQGTPGQCPHCHAKFIIPRFDEDEPEAPLVDPLGEEVEAEAAEGPAEAPGDDPPADDEFLGLDELQEVEQGSSRGSNLEDVPDFLKDVPPEEETAPTAATLHPLAALFITLWQEHEHGGVVEVHLASGVTIVPDWWAPALSVHAHGVFAIQTADGSYVMETVAWDAIQRITIRQIQELPGGVFE